MNSRQSLALASFKTAVSAGFVCVLLMSSSVEALEVGVRSNSLLDRYHDVSNRTKAAQGLSHRYAQAKSGNSVRSRSDVVNEVKRQYNAKVLKITLNSKGTAYKVRILMPNGRVRDITVSASN